MRGRQVLFSTSVAVILAMTCLAVPAHATVHEIVAQWCSGHGELEPPGISRPGSKNFARPLNALGIVIEEVDLGAMTITVTFDYDHPAAKTRSSGILVPIGTMDGFTILLDIVEPDPNFPAFKHCPRLNS